jgi:alginate O-acetyltransferase complex protein AlgI
VVLVLLAVLVVAPVLGAGVMARRGGYASEVAAFATNMMLLRCWGFAADRWTGRQRTSSLGTFLAAQLFFPTVTNGPIEVPRAMASGWGPVDAAAARAGLARVAGGVAKLLVVGIALRPGWTAALGAMGDAPARRLWLASALLWVWFFLSFSAWSDVAIGLGRLWGHTVPENFDAPWLAADPRDFWRRWHVSFGHWLRDYVYVPLGGNRRHQAANVLAVFAVSALWHVWGALKLLGLGYYPPRAWTGFLVWGALNAGGVLVARATLDRVARRGGRGLGAARAATFAFEAACWLPFFVPASVPPAVLARMLARLIWPW